MLSGADDGTFSIWDLRNFKSYVPILSFLLIYPFTLLFLLPHPRSGISPLRTSSGTRAPSLQSSGIQPKNPCWLCRATTTRSPRGTCRWRPTQSLLPRAVSSTTLLPSLPSCSSCTWYTSLSLSSPAHDWLATRPHDRCPSTTIHHHRTAQTGPAGDQGDPLAPADPRHHREHGRQRFQHLQELQCVVACECVCVVGRGRVVQPPNTSTPPPSSGVRGIVGGGAGLGIFRFLSFFFPFL
jgi:hypothetical protein